MAEEAFLDRFIECFQEVPDPRADNSSHDFCEVLFIAFLACLCGASGYSDMAEFGRAKETLLRRFLTLKHGVPSHDTFTRVFRFLDPHAFEAAFRAFTAAFAEAAGMKTKGVVAVDGKALRRAYERGQAHMPKAVVTAWAAETRLSLGCIEAVGGNEAEAALRLIGLLSLKGCVVTADALHCHRAMAEAITARGGDYALAVKANQPGLLKGAHAAVEAGLAASSAETECSAHGREERREAIVVKAPGLAVLHDFPGLQAVARVTSWRGEETLERCYLLSKPFSAARLLEIVRSHWGIESTLHWTLDVVQGEDSSRTRKDNGPANLAVLRRMANNVARAHPDTKTSMRRKLLRAGWDDAFLFELIRHMR
jgi:predicted transposase YbfD/YdcC